MNDEFIDNFFSRNELMIGKQKLEKLRKSKIAILGIGGVGSVICEQLVRLGVDELYYFARGKYDYGNINRQIPATFISVKSGTKKIHALSQRLLAINPNLTINSFDCDIFLDKEFVLETLEDINPDIVFNCVDEFQAQNTISEISQKINCNMMIGGVTSIGQKGIISIFKPKDNLYRKYFEDNLPKTLHNENHIKQNWLSSNKSLLPQTSINKYQSKDNIPYPVITPIPWIISSFMITEFIKVILGEDKPIYAPDFIEISPFDYIIEVKKFDSVNLKYYLPWRP